VSAVPLLEARKVGFRYGRNSCLFKGLDLTLHEGEFLAVVGPSGCGKTSLLKILGGFLTPGSGTVYRQGLPVQSPSPHAVMVFQEFDQLFPWKRVWSNVAFPLKAGGKISVSEDPAAADPSEKKGPDRPREIDRRVEEILREVGLYEFRRYFPYQLSGGMKQRTALARSLVSRPPILLMDEPFGSLDAQKREELQGLLLRMWDEHGFSVVFVTHDISEALVLADRIMVMRLPEEKAGEEGGPGTAAAGGRGPCASDDSVQSIFLDIDLPRPRVPQSPVFREYYRRIFRLLGQEGGDDRDSSQ